MLFFETTNETKVYYLVLWQKLILYMIKSETVGCDFIQFLYHARGFDEEIFAYSNMTSFFRFVNKRAINRLGIISLAHAAVHVTDFPIVNVPVDEWSSARIGQHKLCVTLSANVNINYRLPIDKVYYRICTLRHMRDKIY